MPDSLRAGRWSLESRLGEGSQGTTWAAVGPDGRSVAVKRFDVRGARAWKDVELAEREARVLAQLSHPNLPAYVEHFEEDGSLFLVMEKIEGESLAALRKRGGSLSRAEVLRFLSDASDILDYLHGRAPPVIHRDLKPGNVLRRPDGSYAFVDFGAVRDRMRPEGGSTVVGTFGYMAPEQFQGRALPASDVYAIGATALTLLTGVEPEAQPHKGLSIDVRAALGPRADEALIALLTRMLEPDPDQRPSRIRPLLEPFREAPPAAANVNPPPPRTSGFFEDLGQKIGQEIEREIGERLSQHRGEAEKFRAKTEQWMDKAARQIERKVERRRERDQRRAERDQRRAERDQRRAGAFPSPLDEATRAAAREARAAQRARDWSSPPPPWMGGFLGFHALQIVRLLLLFLLLVVPTVVLSVMGLRKAVVAVRDWHRDVVDAELQAAQRWLRGGYVSARAEEHREPRVRVREVPPDPLRVAPSDVEEGDRATDEDASRPAAKRRRV